MTSATEDRRAVRGPGLGARLAVLFAVPIGLALIWFLPRDEAPKADLSPAAERGRELFRYTCSGCHSLLDPHSSGPNGPPIARSSRELLEAKVIHGTYPPGHAPRQPGSTMQPLEIPDSGIDDLRAFLAEVPER